MPAPTPGYVKNMIRRSLLEIADPSPKKRDVIKIWEFLGSTYAYCDKALNRTAKQGHIDHLVPCSRGGSNHVSNRVLSCAKCNETEKLDAAWQEFILKKNPNLDVARLRVNKILEWCKINGEPVIDKAKLQKIEKLSGSVETYYSLKVQQVRNLIKS
jgi:CRISPR/Cas system Type II protein with McrA/HNH and RuvC-like nuclease domain